FDLDGDLDLFVCHWRRFAPPGQLTEKDSLYRNLGDGTFEDATDLVYPVPDPTQYRPCLAFAAAHLNDDKYPDMYVANVMKPVPYSLDQIYQNQAGTGFVDRVPSLPGLGDDSGAAMAVTISDIDHDGDWEVYLTDVAGTGDDGPGANPPFGNPLYRNLGVDLATPDITFEDNSADVAGVEAQSSWPSKFFDADHDTFEDLWVGHAGTFVDIFYANDGDGTFTDISTAAGFNLDTRSRGGALADYDGDGDLDIAVVNQEGPLELWRNDTINPGNSLKVKLVPGANSNPDGVGTLVRATIGSTVMMRQMIAGDSAHSMDALELHFGLGAAATVDQLEIEWPNLITPNTVLANVPAGVITIDEATASAFPGVTITSPASGSVFAVGASISFNGSASDLEDGDLTASLSWSSDLDGAIGTGGSFSIDTLTAGTHRITASVTDGTGLTGSDNITITVGNATPVVTIAAPSSGSMFPVGSSIAFSGTATDFEDGDLTASMSWTSDIDGAIGTGGSFLFTLS
ncbi:MAG: FG-GAP-like repeat-containing protein, partial [Planctomycetota bacterium]